MTDPLEDWTPFYSAIATVSGSLIGLLFVALSVRLEILRSDKHRDLQDLARQTFADFLSVLGMSLMLLIPNLPATVLAIVLAIDGVRGIARVALRVKALGRGQSARFVLSRFSFTVIGRLSMLAAALHAWHPAFAATNGHALIATPMIALLVAGSNNALHLLFREAAGAAPASVST